MNKIITGDSAGFTFTILYAGAVDGKDAPVLTACDVVFAVKKNLTDADSKAVAIKTVSAPETNIVYFELDKEETSKMTPGVYYGCCKLYYNSGTAKTVWLGEIVVVKGVLGANQ